VNALPRPPKPLPFIANAHLNYIPAYPSHDAGVTLLFRASAGDCGGGHSVHQVYMYMRDILAPQGLPALVGPHLVEEDGRSPPARVNYRPQVSANQGEALHPQTAVAVSQWSNYQQW
jgi:hypothetical protein